MIDKFTPGPWIINENSFDCGADKLSIETSDEYFIAQVDGGVDQQANANLIAAAPDLLQALRDMLAHNCPGDKARAIAAIKKATGVA